MKKITHHLNYKIIGLILLFAGFIAEGCSDSDANTHAQETEGIPVSVVKLKKEETTFPVHVSGNISASKESRLSFKTGGIIESIFVDEGDEVKKGQILAKLNLKEINEQVNQAKIGLNKAKRDYERASALYADTVVTLEQFQNAKSALDVAEANVNIAEYNLKFSTITSPSKGVILKRFFEEDEIVGTGMPIFYFASAEETWRLIVGVSDKDIVKLNLEDKATITTDAYPNDNLNCTVSKIANSPGQYTGLYEIELSINSSDLKLKHGFFAKGEIYPSYKNLCFSIPINAVQEGIGNRVVFYSVSEGNNVAIKQEVSMISITNDKVFFKSDKLSENMLIVVEKQKELKHLDKVKVINLELLAGLN